MERYALSLIIYWAAIALSMTVSVCFRKRKMSNRYEYILWTIAICLPLVLVSGARYGVGTDYQNYVDMFQKIEKLSLMECLTHSYYDILFAVFIRLLIYITNDARVIFFVIAFLMMYIIIAAVAKRRSWIHVTLFVLYYYLIVFHPSLNVMRQCLAVSIFVWSVLLMLERKYVAGIVTSMANMLIHNTAILGFACLAVLLYVQWSTAEPLNERNKINWKLIACYLVIGISPLLIPAALNLLVAIPVFSGYAKYVVSDVKLGVGQIVYALALFLPMGIFRKQIFENKKWFGLFHIALLYIPISYMGYYFNYASRMNIYTLTIIALLVCSVVRKYKKSVQARVLAAWYALFFGYLYFSQIVISNYHETFPYTW